jgi:hypothetical protein
MISTLADRFYVSIVSFFFFFLSFCVFLEIKKKDFSRKEEKAKMN